ncbi:MAG: pseudouridine synthase [Microcoleaceae cyanobacterium]
MEERLQKVIAHWGIASRRHAEQMIRAGRVRVNGEVAEIGQKVDLSSDCVEVDGQTLEPTRQPKHIYLLLNKPMGVISTCSEPRGRRTVLDLLPKSLRQGQGIHPVGRLDANSTGALLLTNDGDLTFGLTHPRHHIPKVYWVGIQGNPSDSVLDQWRRGVVLAGQRTLPAQVRRLQQSSPSQAILEIVLFEGRNRQIRRVAEQLGHPVAWLHRIAIGPIGLETVGQPLLTEGAYRHLNDSEVVFLQQQIHSQTGALSEGDQSEVNMLANATLANTGLVGYQTATKECGV